ncbi:MAG: hypothetical protein IPP79_13285 [Chitinophagaceae bacterium]|nr:hypothetical protein [Chitinophagaceae bacterium]
MDHKRDSTVNGFPYTVGLTSNNPTFIFPFTGRYTVCLEAPLMAVFNSIVSGS